MTMDIKGILTKQVGPMPVAAWIIVGAGGLWLASRGKTTVAKTVDTTSDSGAITTEDKGVSTFTNIFYVTPKITPPLPTGTVITSPVRHPVMHLDPTVRNPSVVPKTPTMPVTILPAPKPKVITKPKTLAKKSYTVKSGDTLWAIGLAHGVSWQTIYSANRDVIESAAKSHGRKNSDNGHWIYPGTVLTLP